MKTKINNLFDRTRNLSNSVKESSELISQGLKEQLGREHREKMFSNFDQCNTAFKKLMVDVIEVSKQVEDTDAIAEFNRLLDYCTMLEEKINRNNDDIQKVRSFKIFSGWNLKGGSSKTTFNFIIATLLAKEFNKRILYIDLDTQGTSSDIIDDEFKLSRNGVSKLYKLGYSLPDVIENTKFKNIDLITNSVSCNDIHHYLENSKNTGAINVLSDIIDSNLKFINDNYDYIFMDFAPQTHSLINKSGFICVDSYVYLTYPEKSESTITGITSFEYIYETQLAKHRSGAQKKALLINKYKEKDTATKEFMELFDKESYKDLKDIKLDTVIHEAVSVGQVVGSSKVLQETDHKRLYNEYRSVIDELMKKKIL